MRTLPLQDRIEERAAELGFVTLQDAANAGELDAIIAYAVAEGFSNRPIA